MTLVIILIVLVCKALSRLLGLHYPYDALGALALLILSYAFFDRNHLKRMIVRGPEAGWFKFFAIYTSISIVGLVLYAYFSNNAGLAENLDQLTTQQLVLVGVIFSVFNAFYEEFLFRGCLMTAVNEFASINAAVIVQACAFAIMHYAGGFPGGPLGALLTFVYGVLMGHLYSRFRSLWPCVLSHVLCDAAVFALIVSKQYHH